MFDHRIAYSKQIIDNQTSRSVFCKRFQSHSFLYHEISKRKVANGTESSGLNLFLADKRNSEHGLEHLFITSSSSHFFNKTDLKQYLDLNSRRPAGTLLSLVSACDSKWLSYPDQERTWLKKRKNTISKNGYKQIPSYYRIVSFLGDRR